MLLHFKDKFRDDLKLGDPILGVRMDGLQPNLIELTREEACKCLSEPKFQDWWKNVALVGVDAESLVQVYIHDRAKEPWE